MSAKNKALKKKKGHIYERTIRGGFEKVRENAEYHQAREDQGKLEARIAKIEQILQSSQMVKGGGGDVVEVGSKVIVQKEGSKEEKIYVIVGSEEADMAAGKISNRSPLGEVLFGKKKGDDVSFKTPNGVVRYKIINVS